MEQLFISLHGIKSLSPGLETWLRLKLKKARFKKGDWILKEGQICRNIYFLESGLIRVFQLVKENGDLKEKISWIQNEGEFVISVNSFFNQAPSLEYIEALEDCIVWYITFEELEKACSLYPEFDRHASVIKSQYYTIGYERSQAWKKPNKERYLYFLEKQPWLLSRVSNEHIASYMDFSPSTFFTVRKELAKGK